MTDEELERIDKVLAEFEQVDAVVGLRVGYRVSPRFIADVKALRRLASRSSSGAPESVTLSVDDLRASFHAFAAELNEDVKDEEGGAAEIVNDYVAALRGKSAAPRVETEGDAALRRDVPKVELKDVLDPNFTGGLHPVDYLDRLHAGTLEIDKFTGVDPKEGT